VSSNAWTKATTQESVAVVARHLRSAAPIKRIRRPLQRAIAQRFKRRGFGEESSPKPLGKSPNRDQAART
jgi:hypothetical protein